MAQTQLKTHRNIQKSMKKGQEATNYSTKAAKMRGSPPPNLIEKELKKEPMEFPEEPKPHPLSKNNIFISFLFLWPWSMIRRCSETQWQQSMHWDLPKIDQSGFKKTLFAETFQKKKKIVNTLLLLYKGSLLEFVVFTFLISIFTFSLTLFSRSVMNKFKEKVDLHNMEVLSGVVLSLSAIAGINTVSGLFNNFYIFKANRISLAIRSTLLALIQEKIHRFSVLNSTKFSEGNITNLMQVDVKRIAQMVSTVLQLIINFNLVIVGIAYMIYVTSWRPTFWVFGTLVLFDMSYLLVYYFKIKFTKRLMSAKDRRMLFFRNIINNIDYVKQNALENYFCLQIYKKREEEIRNLRNTALTMGIGSFFDWLADGACIFMMLYYYSYLAPDDNQKVTIGAFFAFYQILYQAKSPLYFVINCINILVEIRVSVQRIDRFLDAQEVESCDLVHRMELVEANGVALRVENGEFEWGSGSGAGGDGEVKEVGNEGRKGRRGTGDRYLERRAERITREAGKTKQSESDYSSLLGSQSSIAAENRVSLLSGGANGAPLNGLAAKKGGFLLKNFDLEIRQGERIVVLGGGSSGKSSLLYSLVGEMVASNLSTKISICGKIGFLSQERWLLGGTVKENIILAKEYDEDWMDLCLKGSQLIDDVDRFENGLDTVLADTGDSVSGGQRARIVLTRVLYQK